MYTNRFALLSNDDNESDEEIHRSSHISIVKEEERIAVKEKEKEKEETKKQADGRLSDAKEKRRWNLKEGAPEKTREWNLGTHGKRTPFSRYSFHHEENIKSHAPRSYLFRDDSSEEDSANYPVTVTPPPPHELSIPALDSTAFPTLTDFVRPHTPPYPPDDGWYPTLAQRIRVAMERKEAEPVEMSGKKVITMDLVIPMSTRLGHKLSM